jgi:hypothetical protein
MSRILLPLFALVLGFAIGTAFFQPTVPGLTPVEPQLANATPSSSPPQTDRLAAILAALAQLQSNASLQHFATLGEQLHALNPAEIARLLDHVEKDPREPNFRLSWLLHWWIKRDPAAASVWLKPRMLRLTQDGPLGKDYKDTTMGAALKAWAEAMPKEAVEFARQHPRSGPATVLLAAALPAWPEKDPAHRYALLRDFPEGNARSEALQSTLAAWTALQPAAAFAAASSFPPGVLRNDLIATVLGDWPSAQAATAFEHYRTLGLSDPLLLEEILRKGANPDPAVALRWLEQLGEPQLRQSAPAIIEEWAKRNPAAAFTWALDHDVRLLGGREVLFSEYFHNSFNRFGVVATAVPAVTPFASAMRAQREATLAWIRSLPPGANRERFTEDAIWQVPIDQKLALFNELSPEAQQRAADSVIYGFAKNHDAAQKWAASLPSGPARAAAWYQLGMNIPDPLDLPAGPDRDAMLHGRSMGFGVRLADKSLPLALQISDPVRRRDAFDDVMENLIEGPYGQVDAARAWMEKADLPEDWKRPWRTSPTPATPR